MKDENNTSKGFGFVDFEKPEDAAAVSIQLNVLFMNSYI
jgi:RNA recognition motif-containing protein